MSVRWRGRGAHYANPALKNPNDMRKRDRDARLAIRIMRQAWRRGDEQWQKWLDSVGVDKAVEVMTKAMESTDLRAQMAAMELFAEQVFLGRPGDRKARGPDPSCNQ